MKYLNKTFTSGVNSKAFVDNWDSIFKNSEEKMIEELKERGYSNASIESILRGLKQAGHPVDWKLNLDYMEEKVIERLEALGFEEEDVKVIVNGINPKKD